MKITDFEDDLIRETPYYKYLHETYRDDSNFNRYIGILKKITQKNTFVENLEKKKGKELVFLGRRIMSLQKEFVSNYLDFLKDESTVDKWEKFFERYSKNLSEIYENFVNDISDNVLIFEIVNRKLLRDLLTPKLANESLDQKILISERCGTVVNQLFSYIRNALSKKVVIDDTFIHDSYEQLPLLPKCDRNEIMKLLSKQFLKKGLPEPIFSEICKNMINLYYTEEKEKIIDSININPSLNKNYIERILNSHFFFPDEKSLAEIMASLKKRALVVNREIQKKKEVIEEKMRIIREKIKDVSDNLGEDLINIVEDFSTEEAITNAIKKLQRNIVSDSYNLKILKREYDACQEKESNIKTIMGYKLTDFSKFISRNEWDPLILLLFNKHRKFDDERLQLIIKDAVIEIKHDKSAMDVMNKYRTSVFLVERYNTSEICRKFMVIIDDILMPLIKSILMEESIEYYPKLSDLAPAEAIRYLGEESLSERVAVIGKDISIQSKSSLAIDANALRFKNLVSVLVYDIRGSTFMGAKLKNAQKENEIRNSFQESMLYVAEKYGGIPIKDTGDGGIVLFAANHCDIKEHKTLKAEPGSALPVVRCAVEMIQEAKNFVTDNIHKYRDWFQEAEEREIDFEGFTYATLPPSYQSIFKIGIGIASGEYPKEIYLDKNAFGEFDLTGMLVREAHLYSKVREKEKSTVICDDATLYNLLLNVNKFSFLSDDGLRTDPLMLETEQALDYWINQKMSRKGYILDLYKILLTEFGREIVEPENLSIMLEDDNIKIDNTVRLGDEKGGRGKFLFEILLEAAS